LKSNDDGKNRTFSAGDLYVALRESVELQSHYAGLLNQYDGGQRRRFATPEAWIGRLREIGSMPNDPNQVRDGRLSGDERSMSPWRRMTPEEYARDFTLFPPHRAEATVSIKGNPASVEVAVFIVPAGNEECNASGEGQS
jgi:hypothetical protein